jgi:hypothetical protein
VIFQWLDHVFNASPRPARDLGASAQTVIDLFGKYGGKLASTRIEKLLRSATLV